MTSGLLPRESLQRRTSLVSAHQRQTRQWACGRARFAGYATLTMHQDVRGANWRRRSPIHCVLAARVLAVPSSKLEPLVAALPIGPGLARNPDLKKLLLVESWEQLL